MRGIALAFLAAGCAHAGESRLVLQGPPRATARIDAARLDLWIANEGPSARRVALDPDAMEVSVTSLGDGDARCRPPSAGSAAEGLVAPGERVHVQLDLSSRCELLAPGRYRVEVRHPAGPAIGIELRLTRWVNPGPLGPAPARP